MSLAGVNLAPRKAGPLRGSNELVIHPAVPAALGAAVDRRPAKKRGKSAPRVLMRLTGDAPLTGQELREVPDAVATAAGAWQVDDSMWWPRAGVLAGSQGAPQPRAPEAGGGIARGWGDAASARAAAAGWGRLEAGALSACTADMMLGRAPAPEDCERVYAGALTHLYYAATRAVAQAAAELTSALADECFTTSACAGVSTWSLLVPGAERLVHAEGEPALQASHGFGPEDSGPSDRVRRAAEGVGGGAFGRKLYLCHVASVCSRAATRVAAGCASSGTWVRYLDATFGTGLGSVADGALLRALGGATALSTPDARAFVHTHRLDFAALNHMLESARTAAFAAKNAALSVRGGRAGRKRPIAAVEEEASSEDAMDEGETAREAAAVHASAATAEVEGGTGLPALLRTTMDQLTGFGGIFFPEPPPPPPDGVAGQAAARLLALLAPRYVAQRVANADAALASAAAWSRSPLPLLQAIGLRANPWVDSGVWSGSLDSSLRPLLAGLLSTCQEPTRSSVKLKLPLGNGAALLTLPAGGTAARPLAAEVHEWAIGLGEDLLAVLEPAELWPFLTTARPVGIAAAGAAGTRGLAAWRAAGGTDLAALSRQSLADIFAAQRAAGALLREKHSNPQTSVLPEVHASRGRGRGGRGAGAFFSATYSAAADGPIESTDAEATIPPLPTRGRGRGRGRGAMYQLAVRLDGDGAALAHAEGVGAGAPLEVYTKAPQRGRGRPRGTGRGGLSTDVPGRLDNPALFDGAFGGAPSVAPTAAPFAAAAAPAFALSPARSLSGWVASAAANAMSLFRGTVAALPAAHVVAPALSLAPKPTVKLGGVPVAADLMKPPAMAAAGNFSSAVGWHGTASTLPSARGPVLHGIREAPVGTAGTGAPPPYLLARAAAVARNQALHASIGDTGTGAAAAAPPAARPSAPAAGFARPTAAGEKTPPSPLSAAATARAEQRPFSARAPFEREYDTSVCLLCRDTGDIAFDQCSDRTCDLGSHYECAAVVRPSGLDKGRTPSTSHLYRCPACVLEASGNPDLEKYLVAGDRERGIARYVTPVLADAMVRLNGDRGVPGAVGAARPHPSVMLQLATLLARRQKSKIEDASFRARAALWGGPSGEHRAGADGGGGGGGAGAPTSLECLHCGVLDPEICCERCRVASYCDAACQRHHWPDHKLTCGK